MKIGDRKSPPDNQVWMRDDATFVRGRETNPARLREHFERRVVAPDASEREIEDFGAMADLAMAVDGLERTVATLERIIRTPASVLADPTFDPQRELRELCRHAPSDLAHLFPGERIVFGSTIAALQDLLTDYAVDRAATPSPQQRADWAVDGIWLSARRVDELLRLNCAALSTPGRKSVAEELAKLIACAIEIAAALPDDPIELQALVQAEVKRISDRNQGRSAQP